MMATNSRVRSYPFLSAAVVLAGTLGCTAAADVPEPLAESVAVAQGTLEGSRLDSGVLVFKGIPYAAPPVGDLRWRAPHPAAAWEGSRSADTFAPACWQPRPEPGSFYGGAGDQERSEDCLYLNVWTGAETAADDRPVMVWIHGGGLQTGAGSTPLYDGENFASRGVVLVTINYRLGPMGFLAHPELSAESEHRSSGNYGVLDQVAALRWVERQHRRLRRRQLARHRLRRVGRLVERQLHDGDTARRRPLPEGHRPQRRHLLADDAAAG